MSEKKAIKIAKQDNVAVVVQPVQAGETLTYGTQEMEAITDIPFGHKIALQDIEPNENVIKYGEPIGHALEFIGKGSHIHTHNLKTNLGDLMEYEYHPNIEVIDSFKERENATFQGYKRKNGQVGIRNEVWIIPTVGCVNATAKILEQGAIKEFGDKVDGICAYTHNMGCSQLNEDFERTQQILKGLINNPNVASVLILSLGCENNDLEHFIPALGDYDKERIRFLVTQEVEDEYEEGIKLLKELTDYAATFHREEVSARNLILGFKCGGSDAFSGITANALCGRVNDKVVRCGGSTILTEVPEMFGAETRLMERAVNKEVFEEIVQLINNFKAYFIKYKQTIYENPSPGNKKGGISTLEDKSLGCTQKGGKAPVVDVLDYGEQVTKNGLNLLIGPGNDQVSCTNLVASGAQMILFTTGRGNPYGAPVPTIKISSNTDLYKKKEKWIDFDAGQLLTGRTFEEMTTEFFQYILDVASGKIQTKNEINGYKEISIFRDGVIL